MTAPIGGILWQAALWAAVILAVAAFAVLIVSSAP